MKSIAYALTAAVAASVTFSLAAATVYVDDDWAGQGGDGSAERPFGTLQEAAAAVSSLDKISVAEGTYPGDVDFGSMTLTNEVPSGTAKATGNVESSGTFCRAGEGVLMLNGLTNEFAALSLASGSTTVVAPTADGVTNVLKLTNLSTASGAEDGLALSVTNTETSIDASATVAIASGRHVFSGGKLDISVQNQAGKYFRYGYYWKNTAPKAIGAAELILDNTEAKITASQGVFLGNFTTYANYTANIIITNGATLSSSRFYANHAKICQYSGNVSITGGGSRDFSLSYNQGGTVDYYLYGGTLDKTAENDYAAVIGGGTDSGNVYNGTGRMFIYGGNAIFRCRDCFIGSRSDGTKCNNGYIYVRGGNFTMTRSGSQVYVGREGNGTFEVSDGGVATINGSVIALADSAGGRTANVSILTNGTLKARRLVSNANANEDDTAILVLDGGKMIANTSAAAEFMQGFTSASVGIGGVVIDTAGQDLTIGQSFTMRDGQSAPVASTAADIAALAAFTKAGEGTLSLTGDNDWLCATCVSNGTLVVGADALPAATTLQLHGGVIDLGGNSLTVANLVGFGVVSNGTLTVTGAVWPGVYESGTLKIDSTATLNMTRVGCSVASDGTCGCLETAGTLNLSGVTVVGENMENKKRGGLTLARAAAFTGSPVGDPSLAGNAVSVSGGKLRIGAPGFFLIFK